MAGRFPGNDWAGTRQRAGSRAGRGVVVMVGIQRKAPDFTAEAVMPDGSIREISLRDYQGKYVVLFFYPLDWTFVCPTEIIAFSERIDEFRRRNAEVIGVSIDSVNCHLAWWNAPRSQGGLGRVSYPLVADLDKSISRQYGVLLDKPNVALRGTFILDKEHVVRIASVNDLPIGRSVDEVLRLLDALQHVEKYGEVCPANWEAGKPAMQATPEGVREYLTAVYA